MSSLWLTKIQRLLNSLKINSNYFRNSEKANFKDSVTRLGYDRILQCTNLIKNYISGSRFLNGKELWNDFSLKELLNIRETSIVSPSPSNKSQSNRLGLINGNINFSVADGYEKLTKICEKQERKPKDLPGTIINIKKYKGKQIRSTQAVSLISILLQVKETEIKQEIMNHPKRNKLLASQIIDSYNYLIEKGYNNEAIKGCPTILFYHKDNIEKTLKFLDEPNDSTVNSDLKVRLHMCIYHIEKQFHFSGEGIFPPDDLQKI